MAYRPEWDESTGHSRWGGARGWSVTKVLIFSFILVFGLTLVGDASREGPNWVKRLLALRLDNAWHLFPFVTYAFVHDTGDLLHLVFNALVIWFLGEELESTLGRRRFLGLFFGAVVVGGALHLLIQGIFLPQYALTLIGASGGALGLVFYVAGATPDRMFIFYFIPVRARTLAWIFLAINVYPILRNGLSPGGTAYVCHLGGALFGYLFWKLNLDPLHRFSGWRDRYKQRAGQRQVQKEIDEDAEMDRILRKISEQGLPGLTRSEKRFLEDRSRRMRDQQRR